MTREQTAADHAPARHTDPKSFVVQAISGVRSLIFPVAAVYFSMRSSGSLAVLAAAGAALVLILFGALASYLRWRKFTYSVNAEDIRVESGVLSRTARSVPYERIQDVSLEQSLIPRLFGLVAVKFETGSGGGDDIVLQYLAEAQGEALRDLVRAQKDGEHTSGERAADPAGSTGGEAKAQGAASPEAAPQATTPLFTMDKRRLFTFGVFEFSLAVFAVVLGLTQYLDWFVDYEIWDADLWRSTLAQQQGLLAGLGFIGQALGAIAGVFGLLIVGSATGLVRTYLRDWNFRLEDTPRGFRRRRGLLTRTDVVMPAHRVQAITIATGWLRYRFGWHSMNFVSLAQDSGSSNHTVVPFGKMDELVPVMLAAGFAPPDEGSCWHLASKRYRTDRIIVGSAFFVMLAVGLGVFVHPALALVPLVLAGMIAGARYYSWRFHRHALDDKQIFATRGLLSPHTQIASQVKLHSVEVNQGPIAQRRGYATLHLGLAGGTLFIPGIPTDRAFELRRLMLSQIAQSDFSQINR